MSRPPHVPADMLLLRERRRRALEGHGTRANADDTLLLERDALLDGGSTPVAAAGTSCALVLYRPLAYVSLATIPWTGAIDHADLQNAIVCAAPRQGAGMRIPLWLDAVATSAIDRAPHAEPALAVEMGTDEIDAVDRAVTRFPSADAKALVRSAALPSKIVGADLATAEPVGAVLTAYRRSSMVVAWQSALNSAASADVLANRDAAAVQLLSVLRALLGET